MVKDDPSPSKTSNGKFGAKTYVLLPQHGKEPAQLIVGGLAAILA